MYLLHNIGQRHNSNYNTIDEILKADGPISFDGIYANVYANRYGLLLKPREIYLFVMGAYVGKDNSFDTGQIPEKYCTWDEVFEIQKITGAKLGWHTWNHFDLTKLTDAEVVREITPPFPMKYFAYPYGNVDERVAELVRQAGYEAAWSVTQGDGTQFQKRRNYLNW